MSLSAAAPQGASEHSLGTKSVNGSPLPIEKSLKAWYRLSLEEYTRYINTYRQKILFVSGETNQGAGRHRREKNLLFIIQPLITFNFKLCPCVIHSKYFLILNAKRSIK